MVLYRGVVYVGGKRPGLSVLLLDSSCEVRACGLLVHDRVLCSIRLEDGYFSRLQYGNATFF